jgi:argininosuccinate synthase
MAFVDATQQNLTGDVTIELFKGTMTTLSRSSAYSLYSKELATYTEEDTFDHKASEGFMKIYGLPYKTMTQLYSATQVKEVA